MRAPLLARRPPAPPPDPLRHLLLAALLLLPARAVAASEPDIARLLPLALDADADARLRARHELKRLVLAHYHRLAPEGMRLIPGRVVFGPSRVAMEGGFYLALREVTEADFARVLSEGVGMQGARGRAVTRVTLEAARTYAALHHARIPTADELARAARGDARFRYPWGDRFDARCVNSREAGRGALLEPGAPAAGASPWGIEDLFGNAAEWTESTNGKEGERRRYLVVGGSFRSHVRRSGFVTYRLRADECQPDVGFRLARDLPPLPLAAGGERGA